MKKDLPDLSEARISANREWLRQRVPNLPYGALLPSWWTPTDVESKFGHHVCCAPVKPDRTRLYLLGSPESLTAFLEDFQEAEGVNPFKFLRD